MRSVLIYGILLALATLKVFSSPVYIYDGYFYSYLASGDAKLFKSLPGIPQSLIDASDDSYAESAPYFKVKLLHVALVRLASRFVGPLRAPCLESAAAFFLLGWSV